LSLSSGSPSLRLSFQQLPPLIPPLPSTASSPAAALRCPSQASHCFHPCCFEIAHGQSARPSLALLLVLMSSWTMPPNATLCSLPSNSRTFSLATRNPADRCSSCRCGLRPLGLIYLARRKFFKDGLICMRHQVPVGIGTCRYCKEEGRVCR
jgi:hypothetical protein